MLGSPQPGTAPPPPPSDPLDAISQQLAQLQAMPTWDDAVDLMRQDGPRGFRIDIETDSTIAADLQSDQQGMVEVIGGLTQFLTGATPAVESGLLPIEVVKSIALAAVRRAKLGRVVEDAIDQIGDKPMANRVPDPKTLEIQFKQANLQFQQEQAKLDAELKSRQMALDERSMTLKEQEQQQRAAVENKRLELEHARETQGQAIRADTDNRRMALEHQRETNALNLEGMRAAHDAAMAHTKQQLDEHRAGLETLKTMLGHVHEVMKHNVAQRKVSIERERAPDGSMGKATGFVIEG